MAMIETKELEISEKESLQIHQALLEETLEATHQRGEVWLYQRRDYEDAISVGIWGEYGGVLLFEAVSKRFLEDWEHEEKDQMVLCARRPTVSEIKRKVKGFIKRQYPEIAEYPIQFITREKISDHLKLRRIS